MVWWTYRERLSVWANPPLLLLNTMVFWHTRIGNHPKVVEEQVSMLPPIFHNEAMAAGIVRHIALENRIVGAVNRQTTLKTVSDDVVFENHAVTRHTPAQVEVEGVSS